MPTIHTYELQHNKTNKITFAHIEYSDQPEQLPSLIRVFSVCMMKPWVLSYSLSTQRVLAKCTSFYWLCHAAAHMLRKYMYIHHDSFFFSILFLSISTFTDIFINHTEFETHSSLKTDEKRIYLNGS